MEFLNTIDLEIRAFFFNAQTDYLPYYKNFSLSINKNDTEALLKELLPMIKKQNPMFAYPEKDLLFRVNNRIVTGEEKLTEVIDQLGTELIIEPALIFRSTNGLIIDNHDFMHQYRTVFKRHFGDKQDLEYYLTLYPVHYASESFNYNPKYIGDAILITAAHMIERHPEHKESILNAINDEFDGIRCCEYENNLFNGTDYRETIEQLKEELSLRSNPSMMERITSKCLQTLRKPTDVDSIEGKNIALYIGSTPNDETNTIKGNIQNIGQLIDFNMATKRAGQSLMGINPEQAHLRAGKMLLDALDSGAEVLICANSEDCTIFENTMGEIENAMGRDIKLPLIKISKFNEMLKGVEA